MNTRKYWLFVAMIVLVSIASGCGQASTPDSAPAPTQAAVQTEAPSAPPALPATETQAVEPAQAPTPLPTQPLSQEDLIGKYQPALSTGFFIYYVCTAAPDQLDAVISGESSDIDGSVFVFQRILSAANSAGATWTPAAGLEKMKDDLSASLQVIENIFDQFTNEEITPEETKSNLEAECDTVNTWMQNLADTANAEGLAEDSLDQMGTEIQSALKDVEDAAKREVASSNINVPGELGHSRNNPFPQGELGSSPNWDLQILDMLRGEAAWELISGQNQFNTVAPAGLEYVLVSVKAISTAADSEEHSISGFDFNLTGSRNISYPSASIVMPDPALDAKLFTGGETQGWVAFLANTGEENLILILDEMMDWEDSNLRYYAIDQDAAVFIPEELLTLGSSDLGQERTAPAPFGERVSTQNWEVQVTDVLRGEDAWKLIQEANQFNEPAPEGQEYLLVKVKVRSITTVDTPVSIDTSSFKSTGSENQLYDSANLVAPEPRLRITLFPGGEYEGWVPLVIGAGETNPLLVFQFWTDFDDGNRRYLALEE